MANHKRFSIVLGVAELLIVAVIGVLGSAISTSLHLPNYSLVAAFCVLLVAHILVRAGLGGFGELALRPRPSDGEGSRPQMNASKNAAIWTDVAFPVGLLSGICAASVGLLLASRIDSQSIGLGVRPYELVAGSVGFAVLAAAHTFGGGSATTVYLAAGMGLGQALAVLMFASSENSLLETLILTPCLYSTVSLLFRARVGSMKPLLAIPAFCLVVGAVVLGPAWLDWGLRRQFADPTLASQEGMVRVNATGARQVYYSTAFVATPALDVMVIGMDPNDVRFTITAQMPTSFQIDVAKSTIFPVQFSYRAEGHISKPQR